MTILFHPSLIPSSPISQIPNTFIIITTLPPLHLIIITFTPILFHPSPHTPSPLSLNSHTFPSFLSLSFPSLHLSHSTFIQIISTHSPLISLLSKTSNPSSFPSIPILPPSFIPLCFVFKLPHIPSLWSIPCSQIPLISLSSLPSSHSFIIPLIHLSTATIYTPSHLTYLITSHH